MDQIVKNTDMNWDLTSYFPEFQGSEYKEFKVTLSGGIKKSR